MRTSRRYISKQRYDFVEGQDDKAVIEYILNRIHPGASDEINVLIAGNVDLKFFANAEILINNKFNIPFLIIRDSDGMDVEQRTQELLSDIVKVAIICQKIKLRI